MKSDSPTNCGFGAPQPAGRAPVSTQPISVTRSRELFGNRREIVIEHAGALYRLRVTQNDKLILTK